MTGGWMDIPPISDSIARSDNAMSPPLLADTKYLYKNGGVVSSGDDYGERYDATSSESDFRRRWVANDVNDENETREDEGFSRKRKINSQTNEQVRSGWGGAVVSLVGGAAEMMWDFCKGTVFKGFYAGGGKGFEMKSMEQDREMQESIWEDLNSRSNSYGFGQSPLPGQYPDERYNFGGFEVQETIAPRPAKRQHTDTGSGWVMVSHNEHTHRIADSRASSPRLSFASPVKMPSCSHIPRPVIHQPPSNPPSYRRSLLPVSRRVSTINISSTGSPLPKNTPRSSSRQASFASPRSRQYTRESYGGPVLESPVKKGSPLSPDAQKFAARIRREEREADESMRKLNSQLAALIREGKEALQSTVEVVNSEDMMDEGFSEAC
jgi:hypothetical protein